jgi:hypothetical protein
MEESGSLSQDEQKVLQNLQELESFSIQKSFSDAEVIRIVEIIIETIDWISDSIDSSEVELSLQIMDLLDFLDLVVNVNQKIDFSTRLEDSKVSYLIKANTAACYQVYSLLTQNMEYGEEWRVPGRFSRVPRKADHRRETTWSTKKSSQGL